ATPGRRSDPPPPTSVTKAPASASARAWYCMRGLRPISPSTTTVAFTEAPPRWRMIPCARVRPLPGRLAAVLLVVIAAGAVWIRVEPPSPAVFRDGRVVLLSNDPWIHARQVDRILEGFPRLHAFDPLRLHPGGQANEAPLFPLILATAAW